MRAMRRGRTLRTTGCLSAARETANGFFNADCGRGEPCLGCDAARHHDLRLISLDRSSPHVLVRLVVNLVWDVHRPVSTPVLGSAMLVHSGSIHKGTRQFFAWIPRASVARRYRTRTEGIEERMKAAVANRVASRLRGFTRNTRTRALCRSRRDILLSESQTRRAVERTPS